MGAPGPAFAIAGPHIAEILKSIVTREPLPGRPSKPAEKAQASIAAPEAGVKEAFSGPTNNESELGLDFEVGDGGDSGAMTFPLEERPQPLLQAGQIPGMYQGLLNEVGGEHAPLGRPVPEGIGPTKTFLANFAGTMATQLARNPAILENIQNRLNEDRQRQQAIQDQNYAQDLLFNRDKKNKLIALRGQILEKQIDTALAQGKEDQAAVLAENLQRLQAQGFIEREKEQGFQDRQTERVKATVKAKTGTAAKPLTMNQFLSQVQDIAGADPKKIPELMKTKVGTGFLGMGGEKAPVSKQEALEAIYAGAATGGESAAVQNLGLQRLVTSLKRRLKIPDRLPPDPKAQKRVIDLLNRELARYGVTLGQ